MSCLVDTGAVVSVLNKTVAQAILEKSGRAYVLQKSDEKLVTATGEALQVYGRLEVNIEKIGKVNFLVGNCIHDAIIGWDYLNKFGFVLTESQLNWAGIPFDYEKYYTSKNCSG